MFSYVRWRFVLLKFCVWCMVAWFYNNTKCTCECTSICTVFPSPLLAEEWHDRINLARYKLCNWCCLAAVVQERRHRDYWQPLMLAATSPLLLAKPKKKEEGGVWHNFLMGVLNFKIKIFNIFLNKNIMKINFHHIYE